MIWGEVILPLAAAYLVVLISLVGAARVRIRRRGAADVVEALRGLVGTLLGGTVLFLGAVGTWCSLVDEAPGSCFGEALREGTFLVFGFALPVLVVLTVLAAAARRQR